MGHIPTRELITVAENLWCYDWKNLSYVPSTVSEGARVLFLGANHFPLRGMDVAVGSRERDSELTKTTDVQSTF